MAAPKFTSRKTQPGTRWRPDTATAGRHGVGDVPVEVELLACAASASSPPAAEREREAARKVEMGERERA